MANSSSGQPAQRREDRSEPRNHAEFDQRFDELHPTPKEFLKLFLQGKTDQEIAVAMRCDRTNVSKHIYRSCAIFGLGKAEEQDVALNGESGHDSPGKKPRNKDRDTRRDDLIDLFTDYKPEWVCQKLQDRHKLRKTEPVEPENPEGLMPLTSLFYMERLPVEAVAFQEITQPGALLRIKAPGQMGKSSLISRIKDHASRINGKEGQHYQAVSLNFRSAGADDFASLDRFLYWFCAGITDELEQGDGLDAYWEMAKGKTSNRKCQTYLKQSLLRGLNAPLVLCLDNVDQIFQYREIATDFFGLLRAWHENAKTDQVWAMLRIVISYTKEVYVPLDINRSPFNVGVQLNLDPFDAAQVADLVRRHGLYWSEQEVRQLMELLGGHPYLVRVALYHLARRGTTLAELLSNASTQGGLYGEYLLAQWLSLQQSPGLVETMRQLVTHAAPIRIEAELGFKLTSLGVVRYVGNEVQVLCELYRQYFSEQLEIRG